MIKDEEEKYLLKLLAARGVRNERRRFSGG